MRDQAGQRAVAPFSHRGLWPDACCHIPIARYTSQTPALLYTRGKHTAASGTSASATRAPFPGTSNHGKNHPPNKTAMATVSATVLLLTLAAAALGDTCAPGSCAGRRRITVGKARGAAAAVVDCASISAAISCIPDRMAEPGTRSGTAISAAPPRVTISVGPGRYNESVVIPAAKGKVSIIGDSPSWDDVWLMHDELCGVSPKP